MSEKRQVRGSTRQAQMIRIASALSLVWSLALLAGVGVMLFRAESVGWRYQIEVGQFTWLGGGLALYSVAAFIAAFRLWRWSHLLITAWLLAATAFVFFMTLGPPAPATNAESARSFALGASASATISVWCLPQIITDILLWLRWFEAGRTPRTAPSP